MIMSHRELRVIYNMVKKIAASLLPFVLFSILISAGGNEMQGRLFKAPGSLALRKKLTHKEMIHAVALSISSSPGGNRIWGMIEGRMPADIYGLLSEVRTPIVQNYLAVRYSIDPLDAARRIIDNAEKKSIRIITYWDDVYPALLREIASPPIVLYLKGTAPAGPAVAVVGSRKSGYRSASHARRIARELACRGYAVVSGMAVGIDREAHLGALEAGGATVGVMANGIDVVYPWQNRDVYRRIEEQAGSALLSEYPPGTIAGRWTFVRRNRIISGLCAGTVVIKAGGRSGALITARHALEQNREVFACAGHPFDDEYAGCHRLIRNGAVLVSSTDDIVEEISRFYECEPPLPPSHGTPSETDGPPAGLPGADGPETLEGLILRFLSTGDRDIDSLVRATTLPPGDLHQAIVSLELEGRIVRNGNMLSRG